jgi:peptide/nickel transport system substrate-binding protein
MRRCLALALVLASAAPPAAGYSPPRYGGAVTAPLPGRALTWDPVTMTRPGEWQLAHLVYDGLTRFTTPAGGATPHLAAFVGRPGAGGRQVLLGLRAGVTFHRGRRLTAADAVASLRRLQRSPAGYLLAAVKDVVATGPHRVRLDLHRPMPELLDVLAAPACSVLPGGAAPTGAPDGTGAFRFQKGDLATRVTLAAHADHFAGRPYLDTVTLVAYGRPQDEIADFHLGRSLVSFQGLRLFGRPPSFTVRHLAAPIRTTVALLVGGKGRVADRRLRLALYLGIDKERLRQLVPGGVTAPAHDPVPPALLGRRAHARTQQAAPRDVAQARASVQAVARGRLALELLVDRSAPGDLRLARQVMAELSAIGLDLTVAELPPDQLAARLATDRFDLALGRVTAPVPRTRYHLAAALAAAGEPARAVALVRAERSGLTAAIRAFMAELPLVPLFHTAPTADVAASLPYLPPLPWGLLDWASARYP